MSFKKIFKLKNAFILLSLIIIVLAILLFYPFLNIQNHIDTQGNKLNTKGYVVNNYNPFQPRISQIIENDDGDYFVAVSDYQRVGLFTFRTLNSIDGKKLGTDFDSSIFQTRINEKSLDEVKKIASEKDLSKEKYESEKDKLDQEIFDENEKPLECQRIFSEYQPSANLEDYLKILKGNISRREIDTTVNNKPGRVLQLKEGYFFEKTLLNENLLKIVFIYKEDPISNPDTKLVRVYYVEKIDCNIKEIELK